VLDENAVLEDTDLDATVLGADDHLAVDRFTASEELSFGDDGAAATGIPAITATLLLGFKAGGALDPLRFGDKFRFALLTGFTRLADLDDGVGGIVGVRPAIVARTTTCTAAHRRRLVVIIIVVIVVVVA
jgi:hypothetical protein